MFGGLPEWVLQLAAMIFIGSAIKLLDDHLDSEYDICRGERTLAVRLGRSVLAYGLVTALLAVTFDKSLAIALFFSSYAVGMFMEPKEKMPTRVPAFVESLAAIGLSFLITGWREGLFALAFVATVDWLDDIVDYARDEQTGQRNLARRVGLVEATLLILLAFVISVLLAPVTTILGFLAFAVVTAVSELSTQNLWQHGENGLGQTEASSLSDSGDMTDARHLTAMEAGGNRGAGKMFSDKATDAEATDKEKDDITTQHEVADNPKYLGGDTDGRD
ncbi:hypothetical protein [Alicyclobacillus ferrooxydans]|uniref:hypothetical protein n=1 Tax=Alicyclobacillus ferrooxydans TaxID=471514 RepID=UPI0006D5B438|nr:hypothetical protein [Alicyclobacillus ferrooxydans]